MQHDELIERHDVLIARLREKRDDIHELLYEAADALQSQAAEIAHWKEQAALWKQSEETASRQHDKREAEIAALIAAGDKLAGFSFHQPPCHIDFFRTDECTCGYIEAQQAWREARDA